MAYENLIRLAEVMNQLRSPGGCPWDAEQTHESLLKYLLEESYEFIESVESENRIDMREELGDLLLQVYFHARIAQEHKSQPFNIDDVAKSVADKLISRHPHVFSDTTVASSGDVLENWERIKREEKGRTSAHDGVPTGQPALPLAAKLIYRAQKNHLEMPELPAETPVDEQMLGEQLLSLVSWAVTHDVDPEVALRKAALQYRAQMSEQEAQRK
ncbi:MAG: MazG family protein [Candidatus Nanopelagicaceae bacterium]